MNTVPSEEQKWEQFFSWLKPHLNRLEGFVRHQITYFESRCDLARGGLTPEEVIDSVVLRAIREFARGHREPEIGSWPIQLARERLHQRINRENTERDTTIHIGEDIPETPPEEEVTTLGEEIFESYQPDEDLKLEDLFPDQDISTPEEMAAAKEELLHCVNAALAAMPPEWRRALRLRHAGGLTDEELAEALQKDEPKIERILEYARQHLRQSLLDAGCTSIVKDSKSGGEKRRKKGSRENG